MKHFTSMRFETFHPFPALSKLHSGTTVRGYSLVFAGKKDFHPTRSFIYVSNNSIKMGKICKKRKKFVFVES